MDIISEIKKLNFPPTDFVVAGSAIMAMYGLKQTNDIDLVVSPNIFKQCQDAGSWESVGYTYSDRLGKHHLKKGVVELYLDVNNGEVFRPTLEELLSRAEVFEGISFISMDDLLKFKTSYNRPKDQNDIKLIEEFLGK